MTLTNVQALGIVLAVMDESEIMQVWRSFIGMFLMTSAIILLIAFLASVVSRTLPWAEQMRKSTSVMREAMSASFRNAVPSSMLASPAAAK